ncbi:MAG TPA: AAA family ATPase [Actinomycetota bacterium]|nr:AAA family ATPase [Actinomycetota bacterium]
MIGRGDEVESIRDFLDSMGRGSVALAIEGEVGIGRTELVDEAARIAAGRGYNVRSCRPGEPDGELSFSGLADLFGTGLEEPVAGLPGPQRRALEVALLLRDPEGEPASALAVSLAVRSVLERMADEAPVLLAVDDAQWLDPASAHVVAFALRRIGHHPVAMVAGARTDGSDGLPPVLAELPREAVRTVRLGPLARDEVGALLRRSLDLTLTGAELDRVHRACGGNPLFSLEVGRMLPPNTSLRPDEPVPIPPDLRALVRDRLAALPPDAREILLLLACASDESGAVVVAASGDSGGGALAIATEFGIVDRPDGSYRFTHPLFGSVLDAEATEEERRAVHARLAALVEDPEERARHLALAAEGADESAAQALEGAARSTRHRGAPSSAASLARQARSLTPNEGEDDAMRRALLAADCHLDAGEFGPARDLLEDLLREAPPGSGRGRILERLGWVRYHEDGWSSAADLLGAAAGEVADDEALAAAIDLDTSVARLLSGDVPGAAIAVQAALDRAASVDDPKFLAAASSVAASVSFLLGRGVDEEAVAVAGGKETWTRPRPTMQHPSVAVGILLKWADELDQSRQLLETARRGAEEEGTERSLPFILFHLAELESRAGNWATAELEARQAADVAERTGQDTGQAFALGSVALVEALRGRVDEARTVAAHGLVLAQRARALPAGDLLESVLGFLELSLGDANGAHRHLGPLCERLARAGIHEPGAARYVGDGLEALIGVGDLELASRLTDELSARSEELDRAWGLVVSARSRGLLLAASGDTPGAVSSFEAALEVHERLSEPFELGRTLLGLGVAKRRDRRKQDARESIERANEIFQGLGADLWATRAQSELARIGGRAPSTVALTPTEERIAKMVADGATNKEVAAALFLSVKTVEWNLSRIYRRLGVRSRTELARWVAAPGPL